MKLKVGIIGGSGYTGIELLRLLHQHPGAEVHAITSRALQGKKLYEVFPNMQNGPKYSTCSQILKNQ